MILAVNLTKCTTYYIVSAYIRKINIIFNHALLCIHIHILTCVHTHTDTASLYRAAKATLTHKRRHNGGHTSWSAAWEACLWARLGDREGAYNALLRLAEKYTAPRLLSLHPPTMPSSGGGSVGCRTCYTEKTNTGAGARGKLNPHNMLRGLLTADRSPVRTIPHCGFVLLTMMKRSRSFRLIFVGLLYSIFLMISNT
jgi:hypothetical protein